jgi:uncharacterized membrane protein
MNTGLPTWLGWEHHVKQRGLPAEEVEKRRAQLKEMYSTTDVARAHRLLKENEIELVVFGSLERQIYGTEGEKKFSETGKFERLAVFGNEAVYRVLPAGEPAEPRSTASK